MLAKRAVSEGHSGRPSCADVHPSLPAFARAFAPPFHGPDATPEEILVEYGLKADDPAHLDPLEDVDIPDLTEEILGAAKVMHKRYQASVGESVRFIHVLATQSEDMRNFVAALPDAAGRELVHQVLAFSDVLDQVDALDRLVDKAWDVRRAAASGSIAYVNSLFVTLAHWTDDFQGVLTVPSPVELPTLFQSFEELFSPQSGFHVMERLTAVCGWVDRFRERNPCDSPTGPDDRWVVRLLAEGSPFGDLAS